MQIPLPTMSLTTITNMDSSYIIPSDHLQICEQCRPTGRGGKVKLINVDMTQIQANLETRPTSRDEVSEVKEGAT